MVVYTCFCYFENNMSKMADLVKLNVGGYSFTTTRATLCRYPCSMIGAMFNGHMTTQCDEEGAYFIDRDGCVFIHVLNFLRMGKLSLPSDFKQKDLLMAEADFYQIEPLVYALEVYIKKQRQSALAAKQPLKGALLEVIEIRTGSTATMPTKNSRVKSVVSGPRHIINNLPSQFIGAQEKLQQGNDMEFTEVELFGSNIRLQLSEHLREYGWQLLSADFSSSSGYDARSMISSLIIEQSYRDQWLLPGTSESCDELEIDETDM